MSVVAEWRQGSRRTETLEKAVLELGPVNKEDTQGRPALDTAGTDSSSAT
jgi:hypothetical protein